ncbi:transposase [Lachnospiraceae bacterium OttesenSCG-928-D06]|nr:transposase [Lachnospiraceae bacterium OttesenSCG-928-D06]
MIKEFHIKIAGAKGEKYVYKHIKYFRNAEGAPRNQSKAIGKYDLATGKMHPNANYFSLYHVNPSVPDVTVWDYGYTYLICKICKDIGLWDDLYPVFGVQTMDIIVMASYIIREGNAMDGLEDWQQRNFFAGYHRNLTSQAVSRIFASITAEKRQAFFKQWVNSQLGEGCVCYDVTSISSYSAQMPQVERGYNRDGDDLSQYNLGMFCNEESRMPLYYNRYNGSLTDRTNLSYVLKNASEVGIHRVKMVLDGGFWSEECIQSLDDFCESFTIGMPSYLKEAQHALSRCRHEIETFANEVPGFHIYCVQEACEIYGVTGKILVYYDPWNHVCQCNELSDYIRRLEKELQGFKRYPKSKLKRFLPYFDIVKHESNNGFDFCINMDKVDVLRREKGCFFLFTTQMDAEPGELLYYYRAKDADEKLFSQIKVDMDGARIRTHNEATTDGKTFVTFIACIIRAYMLNQLHQYMSRNSTSMKKVFAQLSNIMLISTTGNKHLAKALTKKQKEILSLFDADKDILRGIE